METLLRKAALGLLLASGAPAYATARQESPGAFSQAEQANIDIVIDFYNAAINEKDADKAAGFLGDTFIEHNPMARDGAAGLRAFIGWLGATFPDNQADIKLVVADGDLVVLQVYTRFSPEMRGNAMIEIFRLDGGKIVEHWDVVEDTPRRPANNNTIA